MARKVCSAKCSKLWYFQSQLYKNRQNKRVHLRNNASHTAEDGL